MIYVGTGLGEIWYYENMGNATHPAYTRRTGADNDPFHGVSVPWPAAPAVVDADRDGDLNSAVF